MRLPPRRSRRSRDATLASLVDVVFLLLVFFLLTGVLRTPEPFPVSLPRGQHGATPDPEARALWVDAEGRLSLGRERLSLGSLAARLGPAPGQDPPALELHADAALPANRLLPLLEALQRAGLQTVGLRVEPRR